MHGLGPSFAPTDLSGLIGWYKFDALALSDGAAASAATDSSPAGHNLAQASAGLRPVFHTAQQNGLGALTFDGADDYLASGAYASPTAGCSIFAVEKLTLLNQYRTLLCHAAAATWTAPYARVLVRVADDSAPAEWQFIVEDASDPLNTAQELSVAPTGSWELMEFVYNQTTSKIYRGGVEVASTSKSGTLTSSTQPLFIGVDTALSEGYKGQIGELIYYNRGLTGVERGQVESYLTSKWGL